MIASAPIGERGPRGVSSRFAPPLFARGARGYAEGVSAVRAALFLVRYLAKPNLRPGAPHTLHLPSGERVEAHVYAPRAPWATVLAIHGLTLRAHADPRMVALANGLMSVGVRVVAPRVAALGQLEISEHTADRIADLLLALDADPTAPPPQRVGILSASFAAGQALIGAARPDVADRVSGMLLVGSYVDAGALLAHALAMPAGDPYARLILVRGFLGSSLSPGALALVDAALADVSLRRPAPALPGLLARATEGDRLTYERLAADPREGAALHARIVEERPEQIARLSVLPHLPGLRASLSLIHGRRDPVIPASESERLQDLVAGRLPVRLHVTDLLGHGDHSGDRWAWLRETAPSVGVFAHWLGALQAEGRP